MSGRPTALTGAGANRPRAASRAGAHNSSDHPPPLENPPKHQQPLDAREVRLDAIERVRGYRPRRPLEDEWDRRARVRRERAAKFALMLVALAWAVVIGQGVGWVFS